MKKVVFIVAEKNFRDEELFEPKSVLENRGITCVIASKNGGRCFGVLGAQVDAEISLKEVGSDFDAIVFVGGAGAMQYFHDAKALGLARKYFDLGKIVGAICIAPVILANSGILTGRRAAVFISEKESLVSNGAKFSKNPVESDGNIVTASGPKSAALFGEEIAKKLL